MPDITLTASTSSPRFDEPLTLTWNAPGAQTCTASGGATGDGWAGTKSPSGSIQVTNEAGGYITYTLNCAAGELVSHRTIALDWLFIGASMSLSGPTYPLFIGTPFDLRWSTNVSPCVAADGIPGDGWAGAKEASGGGALQTLIATHLGVTTYSLTCGHGARVASVQVSVNVVPPGVTLFADATTIRIGSFVNMHWVGSGESFSCVRTGGGPSNHWPATQERSSGSAIVSETVAGTYVYTITCSAGGQSASSNVSITWTNAPPAISLTRVAATQEIYSQGTFLNTGPPNLHWTSNVSGCFLSSLGPEGLGNKGVELKGQYPGGDASAVEYGCRPTCISFSAALSRRPRRSSGSHRIRQ